MSPGNGPTNSDQVGHRSTHLFRLGVEGPRGAPHLLRFQSILATSSSNPLYDGDAPSRSLISVAEVLKLLPASAHRGREDLPPRSSEIARAVARTELQGTGGPLPDGNRQTNLRQESCVVLAEGCPLGHSRLLRLPLREGILQSAFPVQTDGGTTARSPTLVSSGHLVSWSHPTYMVEVDAVKHGCPSKRSFPPRHDIQEVVDP